MRRNISLTYSKTVSSKNPEKSLERSESHLFTSTAKETNRKLLRPSDEEDALFEQENSKTPIELRFKELCGDFYPYTSFSEQETMDRFHCHAINTAQKNKLETVKWKKMKCYKRLICKQFVQVSGLCGPLFATTFQRTIVELCIETPYLCTVLVHEYGRPKSTKTS